jgi:hypothetical protein
MLPALRSTTNPSPPSSPSPAHLHRSSFMVDDLRQHGSGGGPAGCAGGAGKPCAAVHLPSLEGWMDGCSCPPFWLPPACSALRCSVALSLLHPIALIEEPDRAREAQPRDRRQKWRLWGAERARSPSQSTVSWRGSSRVLPCCPACCSLAPPAGTGLPATQPGLPAKVVLLMQQCSRATCDS